MPDYPPPPTLEQFAAYRRMDSPLELRLLDRGVGVRPVRRSEDKGPAHGLANLLQWASNRAGGATVAVGLFGSSEGNREALAGDRAGRGHGGPVTAAATDAPSLPTRHRCPGFLPGQRPRRPLFLPCHPVE
jgi:hypothetical protein